MTIKMLFAAVATLALLSAGVAYAQTAAPDKPAAAAKAKPERTAKSLECSKQADAKGLHGKPRKKFVSSARRADRALASGRHLRLRAVPPAAPASPAPRTARPSAASRRA